MSFICFSVRHSGGYAAVVRGFGRSCCLQSWEPRFVEDRGDGKDPGHSNTNEKKFGKYMSVGRGLESKLGKWDSNLTAA